MNDFASSPQPFTKIETLFGYGENPPEGWASLIEANLAVLVGVTGVGKSRTIEELTSLGHSFNLLPNRRVLTDHLIIGVLQAMDGIQPVDGSMPAVRDRKERFAYTRRFRELYPGGMVHALSQLWIAPELVSEQLIFDGLRGVNEVTHAARQMDKARFIALCAPDGVRVQRLLGRNDAFDNIQAPSIGSSGDTLAGDTLAGGKIADEAAFTDRFPTAANLSITPEAQAQLLALLNQQSITVEEMTAKLTIVSEERRNYDPDATLVALHSTAPNRVCVVDTVAQGPEECAHQIQRWLTQ